MCLTTCLRSELLKACLAAAAILSSVRIAVGDGLPTTGPAGPDHAATQGGTGSAGSAGVVATVQPAPAVVGHYGLASYPMVVGGSPTCCPYFAPAYPVGVPYYPYYPYYPSTMFAPVYVDAYTYHFGPGNYSSQGFGHYRFPYYSYRRPWYFPGPPMFNRNTDLVW